MKQNSVPLGNPTTVTKDAVISAFPGRLIAVQLNGGTATCAMAFHNDIDSAGGNALYSIVAPFTDDTSSSNSTVFVPLPGDGIAFDTGCYVDHTGTAAVGWVWFE